MESVPSEIPTVLPTISSAIVSPVVLEILLEIYVWSQLAVLALTPTETAFLAQQDSLHGVLSALPWPVSIPSAQILELTQLVLPALLELIWPTEFVLWEIHFA
jgi:hypothetical protein